MQLIIKIEGKIEGEEKGGRDSFNTFLKYSKLPIIRDPLN